MTTDNNKQLFQVQNILDTLLEATDHFSTLVKNKEFNQCITIFSSIVEGSQAVMTMLNETDEAFVKHSQTLEMYLAMIVEELEKGNLMKVAEIVQFSLRPHFVSLKETFINIVGNQKKDAKISIGTFHNWVNPKDAINQERLNATIIEAKKQDTLLYFFTSEDVNFDSKTVNAFIFENNKWERVIIPFPDVINNIGAGNISQTERKLRREIPFTSFYVGNKYTLPKQMIKYREFTDLLVPFRVCMNEAGIYDFLDNNNRAVFKALGSNRGEDIYFITKKGSRYFVLDQKKERIMNEEVFQDFIENTILKEKGGYIIQKYIHTRTKDDEPYHFRSHVQKNGEGKWQITHIYPRIGSKKSNLSNISTEGRIEDFSEFLTREHGKRQGAIYEQKILDLSIDIAHHLDKLYGLGISELGLDFAIDDNGRIWMHEANNGPQTAYHEEKRAIYFIAYAKYIAKNGIMYTDSGTKQALIKGQFHAKSSELTVADITDKMAVGVLTRNQSNDELNEILAKVAKQHDVSLYSFNHKDIDFDLGLVKGSFYENDIRIEKISEYPDVIIDRLNMRGHEDPQYIYDELADIPFVNEWPIHNSTRYKLYKTIEKKQDMIDYLAPYQSVDKLYSVLRFIEKYKQVIIVPNEFASPRNAIIVEQLSDNTYQMINNSKIKQHSELTLRHALQHEIEKEGHIVMPDLMIVLSKNNNAIIHVHLIKNDDNKWSIISKHGELQTVTEDDIIKISEMDIDEILAATFNSTGTTKGQDEIDEFSISFSYALERANPTPITELALQIGVDKIQQLQIFEANPNGPNKTHDKTAFAESVISYAKSVHFENIES